MKYTIYCIRHGQTWFNHYQKIQGWSDTPLTPAGEKVAQQAAEKLATVPFAAAFSSDARRAIDTCQIITAANCRHDHLQPQKLTDFRESFYGSFEGMFSAEAWYQVLAPHGYKSLADLGPEVSYDQTKDWMKEADPFHDAENATEYWTRIDHGFDYLDTLAHEGDKILLVSHGNTIKSIASKYGDGSFTVNSTPANSSLTLITRDQGQTIVTDYNHSLID
ncbi:histidine phosphatase family protein [Lactobacillus sp. DCY120]|uniref:Histidine phosphatase family protein n=1 Tax=Bombilactobacillus apium TaxID=2675299 RepID=A0A850RA37_9LACO|nr:histidine phosphatase family protein [Bombilactobacillus apium]NVY96236.1 histidine phosphatase family protein [Bombilactobacillus apium]